MLGKYEQLWKGCGRVVHKEEEVDGRKCYRKVCNEKTGLIFCYRSICITDIFPHILINSYELVTSIDRCLCQAWRSASPPVRAGSSRWCPNIQVSHIEHSIRQFIFHWKMRVEGIYTNVELGRNATMGKRKRLES